MTHYDGEYAALDNQCPHQGGSLGEGTIEKGLLRCPWHGWDFYPLSGETPVEFDDCVATYPVEERADGIYVGFPEAGPRDRTVSDVIVETLVHWGVRHVWGIVGHSNLGLADACREQAGGGDLSYYGVRHEGGRRVRRCRCWSTDFVYGRRRISDGSDRQLGRRPLRADTPGRRIDINNRSPREPSEGCRTSS